MRAAAEAVPEPDRPELLLIVEDDALHRSFLRATVEEILPDRATVIEAVDGVAAIEAAQARSPTLVVMDLQMPNGTGVDAAKHIWRLKPDTRILFWSNYADEAYVRGVARIVPPEAVYGYVLKSASEDRLRLAMRGVFLEDQCVVDREVRGVQQRAVDRAEGLTDAEYEVLIDLALGLTDKAMAARRGLSLRGAQSRLHHLYEKLGLEPAVGGDGGPAFNSRTRAIFVAFSRGLVNVDALQVSDRELGAWLGRRGD